MAGMALNRCVAIVAPASIATLVCSYVALLCPTETQIPAEASYRIMEQSASSGANVIILIAAACRQKWSIKAGSAVRIRSLSWIPFLFY